MEKLDRIALQERVREIGAAVPSDDPSIIHPPL